MGMEKGSDVEEKGQKHKFGSIKCRGKKKKLSKGKVTFSPQKGDR